MTESVLHRHLPTVRREVENVVDEEESVDAS